LRAAGPGDIVGFLMGERGLCGPLSSRPFSNLDMAIIYHKTAFVKYTQNPLFYGII
jgi:hypothetical protein